MVSPPQSTISLVVVRAPPACRPGVQTTTTTDAFSTRFQVWLPRERPAPAPTSLDDAKTIPLATASILSVLTYQWLSPIMTLGYQRALQATDLWKMDASREASLLTDRFDEAWARRCRAAEEWNTRLEKGEVAPPLWRNVVWTTKALLGGPRVEDEVKAWQLGGGKREASIAMALNDVLGREFWAGGIFKVVGDTSQLMGPLVSKVSSACSASIFSRILSSPTQAIINFGTQRAMAKAAGKPLPSLGPGVAMAIGLFFLTICNSICQHQFFWRSMSTGVLARTALIGSLYKRGLSLTPRERTIHPGSALVNHMSTDISRVDFAVSPQLSVLMER